MNVQIREKNTKKNIGVFPILLGGYLGESDKDYFDQAWQCAVDDRLVEHDKREAYEFRFLEE